MGSEFSRDWRPDAEKDPITDNVEKRMHIAAEIMTRPAEIETFDSYEGRINYYKSQNYTYIPIPEDEKYYNTEEGWLRDINSEQYITEDTHLMEVLRLLQDQPFLLLDPYSSHPIIIDKSGDEPTVLSRSETEDINPESEEIEFISYAEAKNREPELAAQAEAMIDRDSDDKWGIITLADINRRGVRVMIYVVISGLVSKLSRKIEEEYPNSEKIFKHLRPVTIGRWQKDQLEGLEIHVAEHMNLVEIKQVVQASDSRFVNSCGFDSKSDVDRLNSIKEVRNSVMHANRSLIYDRRDISEILEAISNAHDIIENMD